MVEFRHRLEQQWGSVDDRGADTEDGPRPGTLPAPLVAVDDSGHFAGGLAFTTAKRPGGTSMGIWINAVVVDPEHRRQGVASRLVRAAEREAAERGVDRIFVYTDVPRLYQNLGWERMEEHAGHWVLGRSLDAVGAES